MEFSHETASMFTAVFVISAVVCAGAGIITLVEVSTRRGVAWLLAAVVLGLASPVVYEALPKQSVPAPAVKPDDRCVNQGHLKKNGNVCVMEVGDKECIAILPDDDTDTEFGREDLVECVEKGTD